MTRQTDQDWLTQDASMREARSADDRLLLEALRHPPLPSPPVDFAARVAMMAARPPRADDGEAWLEYGLLGVLSLGGIAMGWRVLTDWWTAPDLIAAPGQTSGWFTMLLLCMALSLFPTLFSKRV